MNNRSLNIVILYLLILFAQGCKREEVNQSGLKLQMSDDFVVTSIEPGINGQIHCVGVKYATDSVIVRTYDDKLHLLKTVYLSEQADFGGTLSLNRSGDNWVISRHHKRVSDTSEVNLYVTDDDFNIIRKKKIYAKRAIPGRNSGQIYTVSTMRNGDFLLAIDTGVVYNIPFDLTYLKYGMKIMRFDSDLNLVFDYPCGKDDILDPMYQSRYNPRVVELDNGYLFFVSEYLWSTDESAERFIGLLNPDGKVVYEKRTTLKNHTYLGLTSSAVGNNVMDISLSFDANTTSFDLFDAMSGELINSKEVPQIETEMHSYGLPFAKQSNTLPVRFSEPGGMVMRNGARQQLYFLSIDGNLNTHKAFDILLPEGFECNSFRQLLTDRGTVIVGASYYVGNESNRQFILQELTLDGELVR